MDWRIAALCLGVAVALALGVALTLRRSRRRSAMPQAARSAIPSDPRPGSRPESQLVPGPRDYLATLAHELRTPLLAIDGFASLIDRDAHQQGASAEIARREAARHIAEGARHLTSLIDDILTMARAEAGQLPVRVHLVDVAREVRSSLALLAPLATEAGVHLQPLADREVRLTTDPRRLREVVLNLVGNAIKFTPAGGRVSVEVTATHDATSVLVVADTGPGMTAEELRTAFEPWIRSERLGAGGTGLGLPLTKRIVEALGGVLSIRSAPGHGTVVTVRLPDRADAGSRAA